MYRKSKRLSTSIKQFMWGFQPHFRLHVENAMKAALEAVGFNGLPQVVLIGFKAGGNSPFRICIEPEDGHYLPADMGEVETRARAIFDAHPEHDVISTDPQVQKRRIQSLPSRVRASAVEEALSATRAGLDRQYFACNSGASRGL